jgi:peroxiredoxin
LIWVTGRFIDHEGRDRSGNRGESTAVSNTFVQWLSVYDPSKVWHTKNDGSPTPRQGRMNILGAGTRAPEFTLLATPDQKLALRELRGSALILAFYPADWSPVCGDQMALYNEILPEFQRFDAQMIGISVDGQWCHAAFAASRRLRFPLLADFEPKGAVAKSYGVYRDDDGTSERALFVIDPNGIIAWSYCSPIGVNPGADGILDALESMRAERAEVAP